MSERGKLFSVMSASDTHVLNALITDALLNIIYTRFDGVVYYGYIEKLTYLSIYSYIYYSIFH